MAELILSTLGQQLGARLGPAALRPVFAAIGQAVGAQIGRGVDQALFGETLARQGPRLTELQLQGSSEGAPILKAYGRFRLAGQLIWAARFQERAETSRSGGGKAGPQVSTTRYAYSLSFAVGLCEGEIAGIGRVWANGKPLDLSTLAWRLHTGREDQAPDPLIEAIEGADQAPGYRGLAYVVFEDLPLEPFGQAIPQLTFEVIAPAPRAPAEGPRLEDLARGVCLIPAAGESVYATSLVRRTIGPGAEAFDNAHQAAGASDLSVSLDQLGQELPAVRSVMLAVGWFGTDLRAEHCQIRPGVDRRDKDTSPLVWRAAGETRATAWLVSESGGGPAYGGSPSDASVIEAIAALKARGYKVGLHPFVLMDVPAGSGLPDPSGAWTQPPYPWRGRIRPAAADKTAGVGAAVSSFFGAAQPGHFSLAGGAPVYAGPAEWSYRRFVLHLAALAQAAGGVDWFLIGSELRGLTTARSAVGVYPAVSALQDLAGAVRAMLGTGAKLSYAADWSEYFGHQPADGSGDVAFCLDPLWADPAIDAIGIDWYAPLTDWRDGAGHADAALSADGRDLAYLMGRIEAGEGHDWFYPSQAAREGQARSPITDGAAAKPWVFRPKDLRAFWSNLHHDRPGGVEAAAPTAWVPMSKPVWLCELGCPAVDKGANGPNVFLDPKSSESALPPFSSGARDDLIQRRCLSAYLAYWDPAGGRNPTSPLYQGPMIDPAMIHLWAWDARPFPAFPARADVWADAPAWSRGHWLTGRAGHSELGAVIADLCARGGLAEVDVSGVRGAVAGYAVEGGSSARAGLEPLMAAYDVAAREDGGVLRFFHPGADAAAPLAPPVLVAAGPEEGASLAAGDPAAQLSEARVRFLDPARDQQVGAVSARARDAQREHVGRFDAPLVLSEADARALAERLLAAGRAGARRLTVRTAADLQPLEPGDRIAWDGPPWPGAYEVTRVEIEAGVRRLTLQAAPGRTAPLLALADPAAPPAPAALAAPRFHVLDLPPLPGSEADERPLLAAYAAPWTAPRTLFLDDRAVGAATGPASLGALVWDLWPGPVGRWDHGNRTRVRLLGGALASIPPDAALAGGNLLAIGRPDGRWELVSATTATLTAPGEYELAGLLRGLLGTEDAARLHAPAGSPVVLVDGALSRVDLPAQAWDAPLTLAMPRPGGAGADADAARVTVQLERRAARPFAPAHLCLSQRADGGVDATWIRRARIEGDAWAAWEPPLGEAREAYRVVFSAAGTPLRTVEVPTPACAYTGADLAADAPVRPAHLTVTVQQLSDRVGAGVASESTIAL